jgi:hypothetical protein
MGSLAGMACVLAQPSDNVAALARHAFSQIAVVYESGGEAPDLVTKLNFALDLLQEANLKRMTGDELGAVALETQAHELTLDVMRAIPAAQERAQMQAASKTWTVLVSVPSVVALSVFVLYLALKRWRSYEKTRLLEMRIVEKKSQST